MQNTLLFWKISQDKILCKLIKHKLNDCKNNIVFFFLITLIIICCSELNLYNTIYNNECSSTIFWVFITIRHMNNINNWFRENYWTTWISYVKLSAKFYFVIGWAIDFHMFMSSWTISWNNSVPCPSEISFSSSKKDSNDFRACNLILFFVFKSALL